jgi:membrane associated rhomboid family serine protease
VALLSIMSFLEVSYKPMITAIMFLITGIGGNIFSACVSSYNPVSFSAGASTAIFGLVGCWIAFVILNWV